MALLLERNSKWKYVINQPGTALPIVPVNQMVHMLKNFKGQCDVVKRPFASKADCPLDSMHSHRQERFDNRYKYKFVVR